MLRHKPAPWNAQPGLIDRRWREHWRGAKAVFPFWEPDGSSIHPTPRFARWGLTNGAARRLTRYGPAVYFPGSSGNEVATADDSPITFAAGEPYTLALLILWRENPGTEGLFRSGSSSNGNWLWMTSSGRLWGRHANIDSPASGSGPLLTAGWHTLVRAWDGQRVRQYVDGLRTNTVAVTATGGWSLYRWGWQTVCSLPDARVARPAVCDRRGLRRTGRRRASRIGDEPCNGIARSSSAWTPRR